MPRYQRRSEQVDEAILGVYLSGTNTRRIKGALAPLLRGGPLSKDAVSRLVGRLTGDFETWRGRDLADDQIQYLIMDGWYPKVRIGKRRERVLVTLGVRGDGERVVLDVRLAGDESPRGLARRDSQPRRPPCRCPAAGDDRWQRGLGGGPGRAVVLAGDSALYRPTSCGISRRRRRCACARSSRRISTGA